MLHGARAAEALRGAARGGGPRGLFCGGAGPCEDRTVLYAAWAGRLAGAADQAGVPSLDDIAVEGDHLLAPGAHQIDAPAWAARLLPGQSEGRAGIQTEAGRRRGAIDKYAQAGRLDLAAKGKAELDILTAYLPQAISESELEALVRESITASGAKGPQDMGRVMGQLMPKIKGRADGKQAQELVQKLLV